MLYHGNGYIVNLDKLNFAKPSKVNSGDGMTDCVEFRFCNGDVHKVECGSEEEALEIIKDIKKGGK